MASISIIFERGFYVIDTGGPILRYPAADLEITTSGDDVIMSPTGSDSRRAKVIRADYTEFISPSGASAEDVAKSIFDLNIGIDTNVQDQTTPPIDALFAEALSSFSLAVDTGVSTTDILVYTFTASPGHGIVVGDDIIFLDITSDRSLQSVVVAVAGDVITIDRPIDQIYEAANTLGRITNNNMNVLGSLASPRIFTIRGGANPFDYTRFILTITDDNSMDDSRFGGLPALTNGLVFRIVNSFQKTIFNFKSNQDIKQFCYDLNYSDKAPAGEFGLSARISFGGQDKHGVVLRISGTDVIQWVVQDDLTGLISLKASAQGHETIGEE